MRGRLGQRGVEPGGALHEHLDARLRHDTGGAVDDQDDAGHAPGGEGRGDGVGADGLDEPRGARRRPRSPAAAATSRPAAPSPGSPRVHCTRASLGTPPTGRMRQTALRLTAAERHGANEGRATGGEGREAAQARATARSDGLRAGGCLARPLLPRSRCSFKVRYRNIERIPRERPGDRRGQPRLARRPVPRRQVRARRGARHRGSWPRTRSSRSRSSAGACAAMGHIPVKRGTTDARQSLEAAVAALRGRQDHRAAPRGHRHPRPGRLADGRQDRRGPAGHAGAGRAGHPGRAVGRAGAGRPVPQEGQAVPAAAARAVGRRRRSTCRRSATQADVDGRSSAITDVIMRRLRARRRRAARAVPAPTGDLFVLAAPAARTPADARDGPPHDQGRRPRRRVVGHDVRQGAGRRRLRRHALGPPAGAGRARSTTHAPATPTTCPASSCPPSLTATHDAAEALDGAELVAFAIPAQTLRENLAAWAPRCRPTRASSA